MNNANDLARLKRLLRYEIGEIIRIKDAIQDASDHLTLMHEQKHHNQILYAEARYNGAHVQLRAAYEDLGQALLENLALIEADQSAGINGPQGTANEQR